MRCATCRFCAPHPRLEGESVCKFNAPLPTYQGGRSNWPLVYPWDFCFKYEEKENEEN